MKGINISCSSHSSTAIYTPISMDEASSSSSSSSLNPAGVPRLLGGSGGGGGSGGRAIDRHNPIIADERRIGRTPPSSFHPLPFAPKPSPLQQQKQTQKGPQKTTKKKSSSATASNAKKLIGLTKIRTNHQDNGDHHQVHALRKSASRPLDLIAIKGGAWGGCTASKAGVDYLSPPQSSRYLLEEDNDKDFGSGFLDGLSDSDPVSKLKVPFEQPKISTTSHEVAKPKLLDGCKTSTKPPLPSPNSPSSDHQVVVLRVSLHCRGCEGKVRKHISRMQGVTSFSIDFAAKKVTVVGDVTPLEVLASISKVKNAQLWNPATSGSRAMEASTKKL